MVKELGLDLPDDVTIRVHDSLADFRYLVIPSRPVGTESWNEVQLAAIVTRDCMVVPIPQEPRGPPVDPYLLSLLRTKKLELDNKHMAVRLKRCRKGQPPNPDWEQTWANYKATVLQKLVSEYQPPIGTAYIGLSALSSPSPP